MTEEIKLQFGGYRYPVTTWVEMGRRYFRFPYHPGLKDEIKVMSGARFHPEDKTWSVSQNERNDFQLRFLMGQDPYAVYNIPLNPASIPATRMNHRSKNQISLFKHQKAMASQFIQRHYPGCMAAAEMGTGKTLSAFVAMESAGHDNWWYVSTKSGISSTQREMVTWGLKVHPEFLTWEGLRSRINKWIPGTKAPRGVIFDEFSRCKNHTAQRSQAAMALAQAIRSDWKQYGWIIGLTGSPAPKSPEDWWNLSEILCPGFLREGDIHKFKRRLAVIVMKESGIDAGMYPQLVTWRDDERKCNVCGRLKEDPIHGEMATLTDSGDGHYWVASINEVQKLYRRLNGLVTVFFKKDCLDLPEKVFRRIELKPTKSILRAAGLIAKSAKTTIAGLTLLRELSDGFQYKDVPSGKESCSLCNGSGTIESPEEIPGTCPSCIRRLAEEPDANLDYCGDHHPQIRLTKQACPACGGEGEIKKYTRTVVDVPCPKDDVVTELLEEHEDVGRFVIYAGFTGSIDRCVKLCQRQGWAVIRMDQGETRIYDEYGELMQHDDFLSMFQDEQKDYEKVVFIAHPKSGGMGLTLTASPSILFFSNTFDAEDRIQAQDRIHRPGMDTQRGATIIDLIHLPSDAKVLENLQKKQNLQAMSMGDFVPQNEREL